MTGQRIQFIDLAKGVCIILVVMFHIFLFYEEEMPIPYFFMAFRMPLYFCLSGMFFKSYGGFVRFMIHKTNKLLIPFTFFYLLTSVALPLCLFHLCGFSMEHYPNSGIKDSLMAFYSNELFPNIPIWFLLCLFEMNILFFIFKELATRTKRYFHLTLFAVCMLTGALGIYCSYHQINLYAYLDTACTAIPFFYFGYMLRQQTQLLYPNKYDKYSILFVILSFIFIYKYSGHIDLRINELRDVSFYMLYPCGILGVISILLIAKRINHIPFISYIGRYSIIILVTHQLVYQAFNLLIPQNLPKQIIVASNLLLTLLSYFLIIPFCKKYLPYVTAQKDLIKTD